MWFFWQHKPTVVVVLSRQSIECMYPSQTKTVIDTLPENVLFSEEIQDIGLFTQMFNKFLAEQQQKQHCLMVLGDDMYFSYKFETATQVDPSQVEKKFLSTIPFSSAIVALKRFQHGKETFLYATNMNYVRIIINGFKSIGWHIEGVVPAFIFQKIAGVPANIQEIPSLIPSRKEVITLASIE